MITKTSSKKVVRSPERFDFNMTVRNTGRGTVRSVVVCDPIPKGLKYVSSSPRGQFARGRVCWRVSVLRPGGRKKFRLRVQVKRTIKRLVIVNIAEVAGINSSNCRLLTLARRAQTAPCAARARVIIRKSAALPARAARCRKPPFTG